MVRKDSALETGCLVSLFLATGILSFIDNECAFFTASVGGGIWIGLVACMRMNRR